MSSGLVPQGKLRPRTHPRSPSTARRPLPLRARCRPGPGPLWGYLRVPEDCASGATADAKPAGASPFLGLLKVPDSIIKVCSRRPPDPWVCPFHRLRYRDLLICVGKAEIILGSRFSTSPSPACGETEAQSSNKSVVDRISCGFRRPHPQKVPFSIVRASRYGDPWRSPGYPSSASASAPPPTPTEPFSIASDSGLSYILPTPALGRLRLLGGPKLWPEAMCQVTPDLTLDVHPASQSGEDFMTGG